MNERITQTKEPAVFPWAICNGTLVRYEELNVHAECHAMRYAISAFEGIRGYKQYTGEVKWFALNQHLDRLQATLEHLRLSSTSAYDLRANAESLLQANAVREDCYLRIAVNATSLGTLQEEIKISTILSLRPMGRKRWLQNNQSMDIKISQWQKPTEAMFPQSAKVISNYAGPRLAQLEAKAEGFHDVVLQTSEGTLSEGPTSNLLLLSGQRVRTPRVSDAILAGITRSVLLNDAQMLGFEVSEEPLTKDDAYAADEALLCGTGIELARIQSFDRRRLPPEGKLYRQLVDAYFQRVRNLVEEPCHD